MDKQLLAALDNLSIALEMLTDSLNKNKEAKSPTATAMQSGNFGEDLKKITKGIQELKDDNKKILDDTQTIIKLQKEKKDSSMNVFEGAGKENNKKMLKDGISVIVLIAGAVLAIGLAFKLIGTVDWKSVLAISVALPMIAFAFEKMAQIKDLTPGKVLMIGLSVVGLSIAIMLASRVLTKVVPIGLFQALTVIFIATAFGAAAFGLGNLLRAFKDIKASDALKASLVLPLVLLAVSVAIALSSVVLQGVQPIGLFQALTVVLIAAAFGVVSYGLGKLISAFKDISPGDAVVAAFLMPVVLIALSYAIVETSKMFQSIVPIGLFQALTAILISATFVILAYAVKPLMKGVEGVTLKQIGMGTLVLLALTAAVVGASWLMMGLKPVSFSTIAKFLFLSISLSVSVIALALAVKIVNKLGTTKDYIQGGASIVIMATTIMLSSWMISKGNYSNYPGLFWSLFSGLAIAAFTLVNWLVIKLGSVKDYIQGGISIVVIATTIMITSHLISAGNYTNYPPLMWSIGTVISIGLFGIAAVLLGTFLMNPTFYMGLAVIVIIAATIVAVSYILGAGSYEKYPTFGWSMGVGLALGFFGLTAILLGTQVFNPLFYLGLGMVAVVALAIVGVSYIFEQGSYKVYPPSSWVVPTMLILGSFAAMAVLLGIIAPIVLLGVATALIISGSIVAIDKIFQMGSYKVYPPDEWVNPTMMLIGKFAIMSSVLALALPLITLGTISILLIVGVIYLIDKVFTSGKYRKYPNEMWQRGVTMTINKFVSLIKDIRKNVGFGDLIFGILKIIGLAESIVKIDKIFSEGKYEKYPKKEWVDGSMYALEKMSDLVGKQSMFAAIGEAIGNFFGVGGKSTVIKLAEGILQLDQVFSKGKFQSYPSKSWIDGIQYALNRFQNMLGGKTFMESLKSLVGMDSNSALISLAKSVGHVAEAFAKGDYTKYPKPEWIDGTIYALQKFKSILGMLNFDDLGSGGIMGSITSLFGGKSPLEQAVSNITLLAMAFEKLGSAMSSFSNSIQDLDVEKLGLVKSMSNNVILLSLMDPDMLESVLTKIEEKGGIFAELIKDFEGKKETSPTATPMKVTTTGTKQKTEGQILAEKIDGMTALLADISSVVGSKGALKNYLLSVKENQLNSSGNAPSTSRSDKRLKNILKKVGQSISGINIYHFTYTFNPRIIYQGVIAQELLNTPFEHALVIDKNGFYSVDYSKLDVQFKKISTSDTF